MRINSSCWCAFFLAKNIEIRIIPRHMLHSITILALDDFTRMVSGDISKIDEHSSGNEYQMKETAAIQTVESSLRDRAYKMAAIANLAKGLGFFHILFNNDRNAEKLVCKKAFPTKTTGSWI
ncbi:hypothetical protein O6H91_03G070000 [Diphasiastrum complanatum]|uniref:Uncharacterized protein n=2 Tax=Diphasiastrum complanatum TaxID=34168 RepID=A0ACC2E7K5_DIPCM|nr:hypothetical protein O6H91_03G070000 [Diphasiastrum complanatum]KAJ7562467.1 hypothetical protein O6H91_03G070000 [Diphasiastrum complanatum]